MERGRDQFVADVCQKNPFNENLSKTEKFLSSSNLPDLDEQQRYISTKGNTDLSERTASLVALSQRSQSIYMAGMDRAESLAVNRDLMMS